VYVFISVGNSGRNVKLLNFQGRFLAVNGLMWLAVFMRTQTPDDFNSSFRATPPPKKRASRRCATHVVTCQLT